MRLFNILGSEEKQKISIFVTVRFCRPTSSLATMEAENFFNTKN